MLKVLECSNDKVSEASLDEMDAKPGVFFVDCLNPSESDLKSISSAFGIPQSDLVDSIACHKRPRILDKGGYVSIIVSTPHFANKAVRTIPVCLYLRKNQILVLRSHSFPALKSFYELPDDKKASLLREGPQHFLFYVMDSIGLSFLNVLNNIEDQVDLVEQTIFRKSQKDAMEKVMGIQKTLVYFHKSLTADREIVSEIEKEYASHLPKKDLENFRQLYHELTNMIEMVNTNRDILTGTVQMYLISASNKLNEIMKKISAFAALILLPTLITGLYGMNFSTSSAYNMPELTWKYGYLFALGLMVSSTLLIYLYFKKKEWF